MKITFGKWEYKCSSGGPYYRQYFYNPAGKAMGCITREVAQPWSDCNNQVTTHYEVTWWFDISHKLAAVLDFVDVFPVLDAAAYVTETGMNMNGLDFSNPTKVAELHADYLANYFPGKVIGEASDTARTAGAKAKRYIKKIAALN